MSEGAMNGRNEPVKLSVSTPGSAESLRSLADASRAIAGVRDLDELLRVVCEASQQLIGTHQAVVSRLVHGWQQASTHISLSEKYADHRAFDQVPEGLGVLNYVTRENQPLRLSGEELRAHPEWRGLRDAPGHPPLPNYLAVPLVSRSGENIGLIQLSDKVDGGDFTEEDEALLVQLGLMASATLEHVELSGRVRELYREEQRARRIVDREKRVVEALHEVGRSITSRLDLEEAVQSVTDAAVRMTGASFGAFFYNVIGSDGETYQLYTLSGAAREAFAGFPMPRNTHVFGPTFRGEGPVRSDDITRDPRYGRNQPYRGMPPGHLPVASYLAVPVILSDGEVAGGLFFGHPQPGRFGEEEQRLAVGVAGYASVAIENARMYQAAQRDIEAKSKLAGVLQDSLLPPNIPQIPGLEVATAYRAGIGEVGGDFYDVFPLRGKVWAVAIGDVCGRGPEAARLTALARHTIRTAAMLQRAPSRVLGTLNQAMLQAGEQAQFCSSIFLRVRREGSSFELYQANAGHPPLLLARANGDVESIPVPGPLAGIVASGRYGERRVRLEPGERAVLYTDGVTEARRGRECFGEERLHQAISETRGDTAEATVKRILDGLTSFDRGRSSDDVAIVVLAPEWREPSTAS